MRLEPNVSFPSSIEAATAGADAVAKRQLTRLGLAAWAAFIYVVYWLGYLGIR